MLRSDSTPAPFRITEPPRRAYADALALHRPDLLDPGGRFRVAANRTARPSDACRPPDRNLAVTRGSSHARSIRAVNALSRAVIRGRWVIVIAWIGLTVAGAMAAGKLADRWFQEFSIPGYSAYEANKRTIDTFGTGRQYPQIAVFQVPSGDVRDQAGIEQAIAAGAAVNEGSRVSSWFQTRSDAFVSDDGKTMVALDLPGGRGELHRRPPDRGDAQGDRGRGPGGRHHPSHRGRPDLPVTG